MKARKVRLTRKAPTSKPRIGHRRIAPRSARKATTTKPRAEARKGNARLAAMAAASAELEDVPAPTARKPAGVDWEALEAEDGGQPGEREVPKGMNGSAPDISTDAGTGQVAAAPIVKTKAEAKAEAKADPKGNAKAESRSDAKSAGAKVADADGMQVVSKAASKFSLEDLEVLKAAIKVRGAGTVIDGINLDELRYDAEGLVPVVAQDRRSGAVLHLGWGNKETLEESLRGRTMVYWSREHNKAIGKEAGRASRLVQMRVDCDKDALLALVDQDGPACHLDKGTCWHEGRSAPLASFLGELDLRLAEAVKAPKEGTEEAKLLAEPLGALKAFVQDANVVTRALQGKAGSRPVEAEAADTIHHLLLACRAKGIGLDRIVTELFARQIALDLNA